CIGAGMNNCLAFCVALCLMHASLFPVSEVLALSQSLCSMHRLKPIQVLSIMGHPFRVNQDPCLCFIQFPLRHRHTLLGPPCFGPRSPNFSQLYCVLSNTPPSFSLSHRFLSSSCSFSLQTERAFPSIKQLISSLFFFFCFSISPNGVVSLTWGERLPFCVQFFVNILPLSLVYFYFYF
ncbi:hypothetical protein V8C37DRAFT_365429, partial [Trichoderma ceciliae]